MSPNNVCGDLMLELRNKEHERKLEDVSSLLDIPVTVGPHKSLNTSKGVIKHSDCQDCTEEEFVKEFPDVIRARRIHVRKEDVRIPTNTMSWLLIVQSLQQALELATLRYQRDHMSLFQCAVSNAINLDMTRTNADEPMLYVIVAARSILISISAQLLPTASIAKAIILSLASSVQSSSKDRPS